MIAVVDRIPLKEFVKFKNFCTFSDDKRFKSPHFYEGENKIAFIYSRKSGKEEEILIDVMGGRGIPKYIVSEKAKKAEEIYKELYRKFRNWLEDSKLSS